MYIAWAPLEYFIDKMYENLRENSETPLVKDRIDKAHRHTVQRWIHATYCGWRRNGTFYEKYDVTRTGQSGYGGEYQVQDGFGWTNGVILYYLEKHGEWLQAPETCHPDFELGVDPLWRESREMGNVSIVIITTAAFAISILVPILLIWYLRNRNLRSRYIGTRC